MCFIKPHQRRRWTKYPALCLQPPEITVELRKRRVPSPWRDLSERTLQSKLKSLSAVAVFFFSFKFGQRPLQWSAETLPNVSRRETATSAKLLPYSFISPSHLLQEDEINLKNEREKKLLGPLWLHCGGATVVQAIPGQRSRLRCMQNVLMTVCNVLVLVKKEAAGLNSSLGTIEKHQKCNQGDRLWLLPWVSQEH